LYLNLGQIFPVQSISLSNGSLDYGNLKLHKEAVLKMGNNKNISMTLPRRKCNGNSSHSLSTRPEKNSLPNNFGCKKVPYFGMPIAKGLNSIHSGNLHLYIN
jgi:hypothetical protein